MWLIRKEAPLVRDLLLLLRVLVDQAFQVLVGQRGKIRERFHAGCLSLGGSSATLAFAGPESRPRLETSGDREPLCSRVSGFALLDVLDDRAQLARQLLGDLRALALRIEVDDGLV